MPDYPRPPDKPTLFHFKLQSMLGQGGTGTVYQALNPKTGEVVAIKQFKANFFRNKLHQRDLQRTVKKFRKFDHPNIVKLHEFLTDEKEGEAVVMEFVDGPSLEWYIANRPHNIPEMLGIIAQICNGLSYIHEKGFIHHDLKPANVLFTRKGQVKLADFSLAGSALLALIDQGATEQVTPMYVAPELVRKEKGTKMVDLYALGIMMYIMFTRQLPFKVDNLAQLYQCHLNQHPYHPSDIDQRVPRDLGDIIMKLLSKKPKNRFKDCDELRIILSGIHQSRI